MEYKASVTKPSLFLADLSEENKTLKEQMENFKEQNKKFKRRQKLQRHYYFVPLPTAHTCTLTREKR